jgi:hypothetical protein
MLEPCHRRRERGLPGALQLAFHRGRFTYRNATTGTVVRGTYVVRGDRLTARQQTGETVRLGWNVYRDTLRFRRVAGPYESAFAVARPWRRVR